MSEVNIEIDGVELTVPQGTMVIEAADNAGIKIPRFCYHKKLQVAANCRMCLVEVEKAPKPLPACATPVSPGMKVKTKSPLALDAQKSVMEFLLINHPLDCPICDQGGQCELQDLAMGYGRDVSRYTEGKRSVKDKNIGPLIATDMTRCIHCTRCVRFGQEIAGIRELGATNRGEFMQIGTYVEQSVNSELSGNIVDLCPVGALTSKPFRFKARAWELIQNPGVGFHDPIGSNLYFHTWNSQVMRVVPKENENINEVWLSDRDRYSYEGLNHKSRLLEPRVKVNGVWQTVDWETALEAAAKKIKQVIENNQPDAFGTLLSPSSTLEEFYLAQKITRSLGSSHIDHRLKVVDTSYDANMDSYPSLGMTLSEVEKCDRILIIGCNVQKDVPMLSHRIRKAQLNNHGSEVSIINPIDFATTFSQKYKQICAGGDIIYPLAGLLKGIIKSLQNSNSTQEEHGSLPKKTLEELQEKILREVSLNDNLEGMAASILSGEKKLILLGALSQHHPNFHQIRFLSCVISKLTRATVGYVTEGANSAGGWIAGAIPHRPTIGQHEYSRQDKQPAMLFSYSGQNPVKEQGESNGGFSAAQMLKQPLHGYLLVNVEPEVDTFDSSTAMNALKQANCVVALTPYVTEELSEVATVLLPMVPLSETSGTMVNIQGDWQTFDAATTPKGQARPAWKILRVLGNLLELDGFDYQTSHEVVNEVQTLFNYSMATSDEGDQGKCMHDGTSFYAFMEKTKLHFYQPKHTRELIRIAPTSPYHVDSVVRRSSALQETNDALAANCVAINSREGKRLNLAHQSRVQVENQDQSLSADMELIWDDRVPDGAVLIYQGLPLTCGINPGFTDVTLRAI